jgi:hypothetical protein
MGAPALSVVVLAPWILKSPAHCRWLPLVPDRVMCCHCYLPGLLLRLDKSLTYCRAQVLSLDRPNQYTPTRTRRSGTHPGTIRCHCKREVRPNCKRLKSTGFMMGCRVRRAGKLEFCCVQLLCQICGVDRRISETASSTISTPSTDHMSAWRYTVRSSPK